MDALVNTVSSYSDAEQKPIARNDYDCTPNDSDAHRIAIAIASQLTPCAS